MTNEPNTVDRDELVSEATDERVFVVCPEEPDGYVVVHGRLLRFQNGRVLAKRDKLTRRDLEWFVQQNETAGRRKYILFSGVPDNATYQELYDRVARMCAGKAAASNPQKIQEDVRFTMLKLMADEDGHTQELTLEQQARIAATVADIIPSAGQDPAVKLVQNAVAAMDADNAAIQAGIDAVPDTDPKPEGDELPESFSPPKETKSDFG